MLGRIGMLGVLLRSRCRASRRRTTKYSCPAPMMTQPGPLPRAHPPGSRQHAGPLRAATASRPRRDAPPSGGACDRSHPAPRHGTHCPTPACGGRRVPGRPPLVIGGANLKAVLPAVAFAGLTTLVSSVTVPADPQADEGFAAAGGFGVGGGRLRRGWDNWLGGCAAAPTTPVIPVHRSASRSRPV